MVMLGLSEKIVGSITMNINPMIAVNIAGLLDSLTPSIIEAIIRGTRIDPIRLNLKSHEWPMMGRFRRINEIPDAIGIRDSGLDLWVRPYMIPASPMVMLPMKSILLNVKPPPSPNG